MPLLGLFELLIAHAPRIEQPMVQPLGIEMPLVELPLEQEIEVLPFVIEGSVDNFDPIKRAKELINTIPRKWCGTYSSFHDDENLDVILHLAQPQLTGQIVSLEGEIVIGGIKTKFLGSVNAKSNQSQIILLSEASIYDLEPGGIFFSLEGIQRYAWKSPRLDNRGGEIDFTENCI